MALIGFDMETPGNELSRARIPISFFYEGTIFRTTWQVKKDAYKNPYYYPHRSEYNW